MYRLKQGIAALLLSALSILLLSGFSGYDTASYVKDQEAIEEAVVGANAAILSIGSFSSDNGLTSSLSDYERQQQIDSYNENIQTYFSPDCPLYSQYMDMNRYNINTVFRDTVDYQISSGVLDHKLKSVTYRSGGTTADADVYLQVYTLSVVGEDDGSYSIRFCENVVLVNASLEKDGSSWKITSMELQVLADWSPEDASDTMQATDIFTVRYDSFQSARDAVSELSIQQCCPIRLDDFIAAAN